MGAKPDPMVVEGGTVGGAIVDPPSVDGTSVVTCVVGVLNAAAVVVGTVASESTLVVVIVGTERSAASSSALHELARRSADSRVAAARDTLER
jgi:hypothetical protein